MDYIALYEQLRELVLYQACYTPQSVTPLAEDWLKLDLRSTMAEVKEKIRTGDPDTLAILNRVAEGMKHLVKIHEKEEVCIDLWEGHAEPPVPGGIQPDLEDKEIACLVDTKGFRPFLVDYRLPDPSSARGTLITVPSIRSSTSEIHQMARVFNAMGYNVFGVEGRMNTLGDHNYLMLYLDAQRAIRLVRSRAKELGIDPERIFSLGGSKGNFSHPLSFKAFDLTPVQYVQSLGMDLPGYEPDAVDSVLSNVPLCIFAYGAAGLAGFNTEVTPEVITSSRIYSRENAAKGLRFPALLILGGNLDFDTLNLPGIIKGLYNYNQLEDKLYPVPYEVHLMNGIPHGFGAGLRYDNLQAQWREADVFIQSVLGSQPRG